MRVSPEQVQQALRSLRVDLSRERFSLKELVRGANVETEHTKSARLATKIAIDHLRERPDYYELLAKVERAPRWWAFGSFGRR